jgi:hypothetical protein
MLAMSLLTGKVIRRIFTPVGWNTSWKFKQLSKDLLINLDRMCWKLYKLGNQVQCPLDCLAEKGNSHELLLLLCIQF